MSDRLGPQLSTVYDLIGSTQTPSPFFIFITTNRVDSHCTILLSLFYDDYLRNGCVMVFTAKMKIIIRGKIKLTCPVFRRLAALVSIIAIPVQQKTFPSNEKQSFIA